MKSRGAWRAAKVGVVAASAGITGVALAVTASAPAAADELRPFTDCAELRQWYQKAALSQVSGWGLGTSGVRVIDDLGVSRDIAAAEVAAPSAAGADAGAESPVGSGQTGTNVQETGVDEPDLAKTDGRVVVTVRHRTLSIVDVTGEEPRPLGSVQLPGRAQFSELLLVGDRAVVLGQRYSDPWLEAPNAEFGDQPLIISGDTVLATVDLSDPEVPTVEHTERIDGQLVSAREYDGTVRVVVSSTPVLPFVTPMDRHGEAAALAHNRAAIRNTTTQDWLPERGDGRPLLDCDDVRHPKELSGLGTLSVTTFDPDSPANLEAVGVSADGDLVYSSPDRLYVATTQGGWSPVFDGQELPSRRPQQSVTQIHAFDLDGDETSYTASGSVTGRVHSRWAFSEHDGRLRVATILGDPWQPRENGISVLEERGGKLEAVGSVSGMGRTEEIRAVRWFGDLAVVVTFRQTDPLYTVDLSDPTRPRVRGELKIPGYSAYLHPIGGGQLLGIGQDATLEGQETGSQVSTFDLNRLDSPQRLDTLGLGRHGYSPVQDDSRAFTYLPERRLAFVPVTDWSDSGTTLQVIGVGVDGTLTTVEEVDLPHEYDAAVRALPLDDGRVAVTGQSGVVDILDL